MTWNEIKKARRQDNDARFENAELNPIESGGASDLRLSSTYLDCNYSLLFFSAANTNEFESIGLPDPYRPSQTTIFISFQPKPNWEIDFNEDHFPKMPDYS